MERIVTLHPSKEVQKSSFQKEKVSDESDLRDLHSPSSVLCSSSDLPRSGAEVHRSNNVKKFYILRVEASTTFDLVIAGDSEEDAAKRVKEGGGWIVDQGSELAISTILSTTKITKDDAENLMQMSISDEGEML